MAGAGRFRFGRGIPTLTPGSTAFGAWATTVPADLGLDTQGSNTAFGYSSRAIGGWTTPMYDRVQGVYYLGCTFWKGDPAQYIANRGPRGIKEVWISADNGPWTVVYAATTHPTYGNDCYVVAIDESDYVAARQIEVRAIGVPWVGQPFVLQGIMNPVTASWPPSGQARNNFSPDMWSTVLWVDPSSSRPATAIYWNSTTGNDANNGLTRGAPVLTMRGAVDAMIAAQGQCGGGFVKMAAGNYAWGFPTEVSPVTCDWTYITFMADDGVTSDQVVFTSNTGAETVQFQAIAVQDVSCTIAYLNCTHSDSSKANNYGSTKWTRVNFRGPVDYDANGQPKITSKLSIGMPNGHNAVIDCSVIDKYGSGMLKTTLVIGTPAIGNYWENPNTNADVLDDAKVVVGRNSGHKLNYATGSGALHLDFIQYNGGRTMHIVEDIGPFSDSSGGIVFSDPQDITDYAWIRVNATTTGNCLTPGKVPTNLYIYDPTASGSNSFWEYVYNAAGTDVGTFYTQDAIDSCLIMTADSYVPGFETSFRYGFVIVYPDTVSDPTFRYARPPGGAYNLESHPWITKFGWSACTFIKDVEDISLVGFNASNAVYTKAFQMRDAVWPGVQYVDATRGGNAKYILNPASSGGAARYPTYSATAVNGRPALVFAPDNASATGGTGMSHGSLPANITADASVEIFFLVGMNDAASVAHNLIAYGGASSTTQRGVFRSAAGVLTARAGSSTATAPGTPSGTCIIHYFYDTSTGDYGVGLFNASQPDFVFDTTRYGFGNVASLATSTTRLTIGGSAGVDGGAQTTWLTFDLNFFSALNTTLSNTDRQWCVDYLRARAGF